MGYYENPPIIQSGRGSEMISSAIANAASSISQGLIARGERKRQEEKEQRLTLQKLKDRKNETDLFYAEKLSDWSSKQAPTTEFLDKKIQGLIQGNITAAADARIKLLDETNTEKRQEYLKTITNADTSLDYSTALAKSIGGYTATYRTKLNANKLGEPGGYVVNGSNDKEILDNTAVLDILSGMDSKYKKSNIDISQDSNGSIVLNVSGEHEDGTSFSVPINSRDFLKSEEEGGGGLLLPVESLDTFNTKAREDIVDKDGKIFTGYLSQTRETVDLPSKGTSGGNGRDIYQIVNGQRIQEKAIKAAIKNKASITANGILSADGPARLKTLLNYTLKQGPQYYDEVFKKITNVDEQKDILVNLLTENTFSGMVKDFEKTIDKDGSIVYWNPTGDIKLKDKPSNQSLEVKPEKEPETNYKTEYYDDVIYGYTPEANEKVTPGQVNYRTRTNLVDNLNKLSGKTDKYITREELLKKYKSMPYKSGGYDTGLTLEEAYKQGKIKGNIESDFSKKWGKAEVLAKEGAGAYKPIKGYDVNSATGRVKLVLDQTSSAGERKILQEKLKDAKLMDWVKRNPKKSNETQEQYAERARKSN